MSPVATQTPKLSLAMIVKNEEATIQRVLNCAKAICDEIIVVDTGSTDRTVELAQQAGANVLHFDWVNDFAAARNYAFDHCTGEWILWLDADDILTPTGQAELKELKTQLDDQLDGIFLNYQISFSDTGACTFSTLRERLIRRAAGLRWEYPIHECIALPVGRFREIPEIAVQHHPLPEKKAGKTHRNLDLLKEAVAGGDRRPRNLFYLANELKDHGLLNQAIPVYEEYLTVSNLHWEKYWALLRLIHCHKLLNQAEKAREYAIQAIALDGHRAEGYIQLGLYHYDRSEWEMAIPYLEMATSLKKPTQGFFEQEAYSWQPHDCLSICYVHLRQYQQAIAATLKAFAENPTPDRLRQNLHWMVDRL